MLKVEAFKLAAIFVINSVVVKAKIQRPRTRPRPGPLRPRPRLGPSRSRPRPRPSTLEAKAKTKDTNLCPRGSSRPRPVLEDYITDKFLSP